MKTERKKKCGIKTELNSSILLAGEEQCKKLRNILVWPKVFEWIAEKQKIR